MQTPDQLSDGPIPDDGDGRGVCIANISPAERRKRLTFGIVAFAFALAGLAWLMAAHADRLWRAPLFLLFFGATVGFFQWRDKT